MQLREEVNEGLEVVVGSCELGLVELTGGSVEEGEIVGGDAVHVKALAGDGVEREKLRRREGWRKGKMW